MNEIHYKALIIDDEALSADMLEYMVRKHTPVIDQVKKATSAASGLSLIHSFRPQLLFLDIQMPFINGFELLSRLPDYDFSVIFITAYEKYAIKAIRFSALDYLLKPVDPDELKEAIEKFLRVQAKQTEYRELYRNFIRNLKEKEPENYRLALPANNGLRLVWPSEIFYCEGENNYTHFYLKDGERLITSKTIKEYEEILSEHRLIRVHKSFLVNLDYVKGFDSTNDTILLKNGKAIPVSRRRKHEVLERLKADGPFH